jgi:hypothetical protein
MIMLVNLEDAPAHNGHSSRGVCMSVHSPTRLAKAEAALTPRRNSCSESISTIVSLLAYDSCILHSNRASKAIQLV